MVSEFWEGAFDTKQLMWGLAPTASAVAASEALVRAGAKSVLIPGIGYGRNAQPFLERGLSVAGVEISETAIALARSQLGLTIPIVHGSVTDMPFGQQKYDGVYCHGLIYLLDAPGRQKLIRDCYRQLEPGGQMIFTVISKRAPMYGQGPRLGEDWYERLPGLPMYFYDADSVRREFGPYGLVEITELDEPAGGGATLPFLQVVCRRDAVKVDAAAAVERLQAGQVEVTVVGALTEEEVVAIAQALARSTTSVLSMGGCHVTGQGGAALASALRVQSHLRELWLFNNQVDDLGAQAFGDALKSNSSLTTLCLNENQLGDAGAAAIADGLRSTRTLLELGLGRNHIGDLGGAAIAEALTLNRSLVALSLNHNRIGDAGAIRLGHALHHNATLATLRLSHNPLGADGAEALRAGVMGHAALNKNGLEAVLPGLASHAHGA